MKVTVGIKALNEEGRIAEAIASALEALKPFDGRVILADSGSNDKTIEIALQYPIDIVQLADQTERSCGAGAQLAFQHAVGAYFYLLDGDMVLDADFLRKGIAYLEANPQLAGVGGRVRERNTQSHEFQIRADTVARDSNWQTGVVDRLDCGGLYRSSAVREVGYFADRNLHAFEEFELAARLQAKGWELARIDALAVDHYGHRTDGYRLLYRRLRSGYAGASGEVLRGALGHPHLGIVLRRLGHIRYAAIVVTWWLALLISLVVTFPVADKIGLLFALLLGPVVFLAWRRRSWNLGLYSLVSWNVGTLGLLAGLVRKRTAPDMPLSSVVVTKADRVV